MLPFTREQFFALFAAYNGEIWPVQIAAYLLGLAAVGLVFFGRPTANRIVFFVLALMWAWTGLVYHGLYFATINGAAVFFALCFLAQAAALVTFGARSSAPLLHYRASLQAKAGLLFLLYSAFVYPVLGLMLGHSYETLPMFGVSPCPVTLFTFGFLLLATPPPPWWLWIIPVAWSLIGGTAAFLLGVPQDWLLLASGVVSLMFWYGPRSKFWRGASALRTGA